MDAELQWSQLRLNEKIQNLYNTSSFSWPLRDALGDTLLEATLDEKKMADKQKVMQSLGDMCRAHDASLEAVFQGFISSFDKPSQSYTELKKLVTAEKKIIRALESATDEPVQTFVKSEAMDTDNDIYEALDRIKANVSAMSE